MAELKCDISAELVASFCRQWQISELALFGSILRGDFGPGSDLDVLVTFAPDTRWSLLDHIQMEKELENLLNCPVDLLTKQAVERSSNWLLRREILGTAEVIYDAARR